MAATTTAIVLMVWTLVSASTAGLMRKAAMAPT